LASQKVSNGTFRCYLRDHAAMTTLIALIARGFQVASITIRNLEEALKRKLRLRAAQRDRSMEDEARDILRTALAEGETSRKNLADAMRRRLDPLGGIELTLPPRGPMRAPPDFK
jgi:antitoxin FitA